MKKILTLAMAFMFVAAITVNAQNVKKDVKTTPKAKTEKVCCKDKKACSKDAKVCCKNQKACCKDAKDCKKACCKSPKGQKAMCSGASVKACNKDKAAK